MDGFEIFSPESTVDVSDGDDKSDGEDAPSLELAGSISKEFLRACSKVELDGSETFSPRSSVDGAW